MPRSTRKPPADAPLPDPAEPSPAAAVFKRERTRWLRHEATLARAPQLGHDVVVARVRAQTAQLVLTFALAVVDGRPARVGSFDDLAGHPHPPTRTGPA